MTVSECSASDVVITGMGLVSPLGSDVEAAWKLLVAAERTHARTLVLGAASGLSEISACPIDPLSEDRIDELPRQLRRRVDRATALALLASRSALDFAGGAAPADGGIFVGTGGGCVSSLLAGEAKRLEGKLSSVSPYALPKSLHSAIAAEIALDLRWHQEAQTLVSACASGATAVGQAVRAIRSGEATVALAGGVDTLVNHTIIAGFNRLRALSHCTIPEKSSRPFDAARDGFVIAEGAAMLLLETRRSADEQGREPLATVAGVGVSTDAYHPVAPDPSADHTSACLAQAIRRASIDSRDVGAINAHGTGTVLNDRAEALAFHRVFGTRHVPTVTANKSVTGHMLGASSAFEIATSVLMLRDRIVPSVANLVDPDVDLPFPPAGGTVLEGHAVASTSFGFGGHNVAVVLLGEDRA